MQFKKLLSAALAGLMLFAASDALAQRTISVSGTVTDAEGQPVIGAGVVVAGTRTGDITDLDGKYHLADVAPNATLTFSGIGYTTVDVPVQGRSVIDQVLEEDYLALEESVVIGYGTQRKADVTSAVANVKSEDFLAGNIGDAAQLVKGKVAGLNVTKGNGDPNSSSTIMLRGVNSLMGGYTPLVLVDGIEGSLATVAPESIEEITVLKDASAAAIYGTRGAAGVILITTKAGKVGERFNISYNGYASISHFSKRVDFMDADFMHMLESLGKNKKGVSYLSIYSPFADLGYSTDWLGEVTQPGFAHNHNIALEGGSKHMAYSANITYRDNQGVIVGSYGKDLRAQMDLTQYLFDDILKVNFNMLKTLSESDNQDSWTMYHQAVIRNPTAPIYVNGDPNEDYYEQTAPLYYYNPVPYNKEHTGDYRIESTRLTANITLEPITGWKTNLQLSTRRNNSLNEYYNTAKYQGNRWGDINGSAGKSQGDFKQNLLELTTQYDRLFGKHHVSAMAGYSWMRSISSGFGASNSEFPTDAYLYNNLGAGRLAELQESGEGDNKTYTLRTYGGVSSSKSENTLIGFFGRLTYNFDNRFNLLATLRYEGTTKFAVNNKWGLFPAVSVGWTLSNEDWLKDVKWLNNLKIRAGYGKTGVIPGSSYMSLLLYDYDTSYGNYITPDGKWRPSLTPTQNENRDLKWETSNEFNVGADFGFFDGRLYGSLDVYYKITTDLLWDYSVPVPPNLYGQTTANVGSMSNRGVELMLGGTPVRTRDFEWNTTFTVSHNKNRLESLSNELYETEDYIDGAWTEEPTSMVLQRTYVGGALGDFYMLKSTGIGSKGAAKGLWMIEDPETGESTMFLDGMRSYDSRFRQYLGSGVPVANFGWSNTFRYKGLDLTLAFSSAVGFKIFNCQRMFYENLNIGLNRYKSAVLPVYGGTLSASQQPVAVSYYLENGDYLKLDNVNLGYTFKTDGIKYLDRARIFFSGENVFTLTGYKGIDPEMSSGDRFGFGVDYRNKYPTIRTFTVGVNVTFGGSDHAAAPASPSRVEPYVREKVVEKIVEKEIIKEVPVEKIVEKEVIKEVIKEVPAGKLTDSCTDDIYFLLGSTEIRPEEAVKLGQLVQILKENPDATITITGHADSATGTAEINKELSAKRAATVADMLKKAGIAASRISYSSTGTDANAKASPESNRVAVCIVK